MAAVAPSDAGVSPTGPTALALLRFVRGISQRELARRAGVSKRTVAYLERGRHTPRIETAVAVSRALGITDPRAVFPEAFQTDMREAPGFQPSASPDRQWSGERAGRA